MRAARGFILPGSRSVAALHRLIDERWITDDGRPGRSHCGRAEARGFIRLNGILCRS